MIATFISAAAFSKLISYDPLGGRTAVSFEKVVIDRRFVAEGVAVADVNRDKKLDIIAGNCWYEAPRWTVHEIAPYTSVDPKQAYSNCFNTWADDLNHDGYPDQILIGMPGERVIWRENPGKKAGRWREHPIWRSAGNESPLYEDLFGTGKRVLVMGYDDDKLAWFEPAAAPHQEWICHDISVSKGAGSFRYAHGLGIGDLDGDNRNEILTTQGYYRMLTPDKTALWTFVKADLGPDCAQMRVNVEPGTKARSILTTSAHSRGVWWFIPTASGGFQRVVLDETVSETHAANLAQLGKHKAPNLITGKRKWAHPPGVDVGSEEPSWLVRYELVMPASGPSWERHVIDEDSGVGTQFVTQDMDGDGLVDIVIANKNGVFLFVQKSGSGLQ